jgi:hypothetical protein
MRKIIMACAMLGAMSVGVQAQGVMVDQYGHIYVGAYRTESGVVIAVDPITGMAANGYMPRMPESDPSMFGQVRPDGSIIGVDGQ